MKKESKILTATLVLTFIVLSSVILVQGAIQVTNEKAVPTTSFEAGQTVYLKSDAGLCNSAFKTVDVYIVKSGETESLDDVRGEPEEVELTVTYAIPRNKEIWSEAKVGSYNVIIDCDKDGSYHLLEPKASFMVASEAEVTVSVGSKNVGNHSWFYDPEEDNIYNVMLQIKLVSNGGDIELEEMVLEAEGSGDDSEIDSIEIYVDENNDGKLGGAGDSETEIGEASSAYSEDDGESNVEIDYDLEDGIITNLLVVYKMKDSIEEGEFSLKVKSISGKIKDTETEVNFLGLPIVSGVKTVLPKITCVGDLTLILSPNPAPYGAIVVARMSGISGCEDKTITLSKNKCNSTIIAKAGSCVSGESGCQLNVPGSRNTTYYACLDKNGDGDSEDEGEEAVVDLIVLEKGDELEEVEETEEEEEETEEEISVEVVEGDEESGVTGAAVSLEDRFVNSGSFLILLEVTLLLILFVLILILFKLKGPAPAVPEEEEPEVHKDSKKKSEEKK